MRKSRELGMVAGAVPWARRRRDFPSGGFRLACTGMVLITLGPVMLPLRAQSVSEPEVKAAFLYSFTKFIEWPSDPPRPASGEFTFCFSADDAVGRALARSVSGKVVTGQRATVRRVMRLEEIRGCDLIFLGTSETQHLFRGLQVEESFGILTVGEEEQFLEKGGMINLIVADDRIRFEISLDAAERAGFRISSRLLNLAKVVQTKRHEERR